MAHYAFIDENNIVVEVIVGRNEDEVVDGISDWESHYAEFRSGLICKRTSYNNNIRKKFAGIGMTYNEVLDAFIAPKPYPSWVLNEETCDWEAPTPKPTDDKTYRWDESAQNWEEVDG
jgi:hypothetical protein